MIAVEVPTEAPSEHPPWHDISGKPSDVDVHPGVDRHTTQSSGRCKCSIFSFLSHSVQMQWLTFAGAEIGLIGAQPTCWGRIAYYVIQLEHHITTAIHTVFIFKEANRQATRSRA